VWQLTDISYLDQNSLIYAKQLSYNINIDGSDDMVKPVTEPGVAGRAAMIAQSNTNRLTSNISVHGLNGSSSFGINTIITAKFKNFNGDFGSALPRYNSIHNIKDVILTEYEMAKVGSGAADISFNNFKLFYYSKRDVSGEYSYRGELKTDRGTWSGGIVTMRASSGSTNYEPMNDKIHRSFILPGERWCRIYAGLTGEEPKNLITNIYNNKTNSNSFTVNGELWDVSYNKDGFWGDKMAANKWSRDVSKNTILFTTDFSSNVVVRIINPASFSKKASITDISDASFNVQWSVSRSEIGGYYTSNIPNLLIKKYNTNTNATKLLATIDTSGTKYFGPVTGSAAISTVPGDKIYYCLDGTRIPDCSGLYIKIANQGGTINEDISTNVSSSLIGLSPPPLANCIFTTKGVWTITMNHASMNPTVSKSTSITFPGNHLITSTEYPVLKFYSAIIGDNPIHLADVSLNKLYQTPTTLLNDTAVFAVLSSNVSGLQITMRPQSGSGARVISYNEDLSTNTWTAEKSSNHALFHIETPPFTTINIYLTYFDSANYSIKRKNYGSWMNVSTSDILEYKYNYSGSTDASNLYDIYLYFNTDDLWYSSINTKPWLTMDVTQGSRLHKYSELKITPSSNNLKNYTRNRINAETIGNANGNIPLHGVFNVKLKSTSSSFTNKNKDKIEFYSRYNNNDGTPNTINYTAAINGFPGGTAGSVFDITKDSAFRVQGGTYLVFQHVTENSFYDWHRVEVSTGSGYSKRITRQSGSREIANLRSVQQSKEWIGYGNIIEYGTPCQFKPILNARRDTGVLFFTVLPYNNGTNGKILGHDGLYGWGDPYVPKDLYLRWDYTQNGPTTPTKGTTTYKIYGEGDTSYYFYKIYPEGGFKQIVKDFGSNSGNGWDNGDGDKTTSGRSSGKLGMLFYIRHDRWMHKTSNPTYGGDEKGENVYFEQQLFELKNGNMHRFNGLNGNTSYKGSVYITSPQSRFYIPT
tara:strand:+ start:225 stop:3170 length:2946 start_codon:yes stop_codon:yes gene_type:complete